MTSLSQLTIFLVDKLFPLTFFQESNLDYPTYPLHPDQPAAFSAKQLGAVQTYSWVAFTDSLETGSKVKPSKVLVTLKGDVKVVMTKASDPDSLQGQFKWLRAKQT
jgi:hypothetical protein